MRSLLFGIFILGGAAVMVFGHWYLWRRLARDVTRRRWLRRLILSVLLLLAGLAMVSMALPRIANRQLAGSVVFVGLLWMGTAFYLVVLLGAADLVRAATGLVRKLWRRSAPVPETPVDLSRRMFLSRLVAGGAVLGSGGIAAAALHAARTDLTTPEVPVRLARLPRALSGFRIALISDMHLGPTLGAKFCRRVVERTNALKPDAVAITGDLVDGTPALIGADVAPLAGLKARHGVFFTTGNHEYYSGVESWMEFLGRLGVRVLANQHVLLGDHSAAGARFALAGIHDRHGGWLSKEHAPDPARALAGCEPDLEVVMLAHQPVQVDSVAAQGAGLQLSGHTHGGQIFPIGALTMIAQPYLYGLHQHTAGTQIYVSRGTGYWGPPMRVMAPAEISLVVLTA